MDENVNNILFEVGREKPRHQVWKATHRGDMLVQCSFYGLFDVLDEHIRRPDSSIIETLRELPINSATT